MPNEIKYLVIDEVSFVDKPANSEVDASGQKQNRAVVAIWKRDSSKEGKPMGLKKIMKSANVTREQICTALREKAVKIARRDGISIDLAEAKVWRKNPEALELYERVARPNPPKRERRFANQTHAEAVIDNLARKRMKRTGESYANAVRSTLDNDPSLYDSYQKEMEQVATYLLPEPPEYLGTTLPHSKGSAMIDDIHDDDDDEDDIGNGKRKHSPADAVPDHAMYARRQPSTTVTTT
jgi:hypothetical protein